MRRLNPIPLLLFVALAARAEDFEFFEKSIRPAFVEHCQECHGEEKQKGGLRLDLRAGWMTGGDSGPAIVAGQPEESRLFKAISYRDADLKMPPKGKLPDHVIRAFEKWIHDGAPDPRAGTVVAKQRDTPTIQDGRRFWSFQPLQAPPVPEVRNKHWARTDSDRFLLDRLEQAGLTPAAPASPEALIRRLYYDLTGLPPTVGQLTTAREDLSDQRYAALVAELLASPRFGERWGRHWLDVARFAESSGGGRTLLFPDAWRYRDYVIGAFNNDLPFNQFIREQLAGDLLPGGDWQERARRITATAFLVLGPTNYELQDKDVLEMDIIDEQLDTLGKAFMGMTIGCARCHDHKFDPIELDDYYGMAGIFKSTRSVVHDNVSKWSVTDLPLPPKEEALFASRAEELSKLQEELKQLEAEAAKIRPPAPAEERSSKSVPASSLPGIVVDDRDAVFTGDWKESTHTAPYVNAGYMHDQNRGKGLNTATFSTTLPHPGEYEVQLAWTPDRNRSTRTPVTVHHAAGATRQLVDQRAPAPIDRHRITLGRFRFDADGKAEVVIANDEATDGTVIADAVLFIPLADQIAKTIPPLPKPEEVDNPELIPFIVPDPSTLEGIVVDNTAAELVGEWGHSVHTPPFVGAGYLHDRKEAKGAKSATFRPRLPRAGTYEVRVSHNTNIRRSTNAPVTIRHADGETTVRINEGETAPIDRLFRSLGEFRFTAGTNGAVTIGTTGTEGKYVIVDAVQFIFRPLSQKHLERLAELDARIAELKPRISKLQKLVNGRARAMAVSEGDTIGDIPLAIRGVAHNRGRIVPRGVMRVATLGDAPVIPADASGRREFADWLASPRHPLTARVLVNRVWYWLFGRGIVRSLDNFGMTGTPPTHPELLDHLATRFIAHGWSVKQLVREIVLSSAYRMGTADNPRARRVDPENNLFWRRDRQRLDAEAIRDTLLYIAGTLDEQRGGSNIKAGTRIEYGYRFESTRRSVYVPVFRNTLPEIFTTFDFADPNIQVGRRTTSTIAPQALLLLNSPFVVEQSRAAAERLLQPGELTTTERIRRAHLQTLGRAPTPAELASSRRFIGNRNDPDRWALLYQTLFATLDFRYLE